MPECRLNTLLSCADDGTLLETPCGEDRCAGDSPIPRCVPANALPCSPRRDEPRCLNGHIIDCDEDSGYLLERGCGPGQLCVGQDNTVRCGEAASVVCSPARWAPLCVDDELFTCGDRSRLVVAQGCD